MVDLGVLANKCFEISEIRKKNKAVEPDIWKACATEVVEAKEAGVKFSWVKNYYDEMPENLGEKIRKQIKVDDFPDSLIEKYKEGYAEEIADVIICGLTASKKAGIINLEQVILDKIKKNELRAYKKGDKY